MLKQITGAEAIGRQLKGLHLDCYDSLILTFSGGVFVVFQIERDKYEDTVSLREVTIDIEKFGARALVLAGVMTKAEMDAVEKPKKKAQQKAYENHERAQYEQLRKKFERK